MVILFAAVALTVLYQMGLLYLALIGFLLIGFGAILSATVSSLCFRLAGHPQ
jgi:hypothetical protein